MQTFIADGRVSDIPQDAVGKTSNGNVSFKFDFVCDSSLLDENRKPTPSFFHVQMYGKQAEVMAKSLSKGSPILLKGEIIQRSYTSKGGQRRQAQVPGTNIFQSELAPTHQEAEGSSAYPIPMDADEPF